MTMHGTHTLASLYEQKCDVEGRLLRTLHSLCGTLAGIHRLGLSHNDVKASNIMIGGGSDPSTIEVTLIDLGILTRHGEYPFGRTPTCLKDKPCYAPEMTCSNSPVSEATDMYSFGYLLKSMTPRLKSSHQALRKLYQLALGYPSRRPTFVEARRVVKNAANALNAWPPYVSPE